MKHSLSTTRIIWSLAPMVMTLALAMDIYIPAVPNIADLFHVTAGTMQLTLTFFMLTAGFLQLIIGPLSDQLGRKNISYLSIAIFALGTVLCAIASNVTQLIVYRIIQASGSCGMLVIGFAMVRDVSHGRKSARIYSFLNSLIAFSPMLAPFVGSYLDIRYGWPSTFLALLVIAIVAGLTIKFTLPETLSIENRQVFNLGIFSEYKGILCNIFFFYYTLATAIGLTYFYLFFSISPYIIIRLLHIPEAHYGFYFCFMGISFFTGGFLSAIMISKIGVYRTVMLGFAITLLGGLLMALWYTRWGLSIHNFIWPMLLIGIGGTFCMGAGNGGAMEPFAKSTGAASALSGAFRFLFAGVCGVIVISKNVTSTLPLALPAIVFSILGILLFSLKKRSLDFLDTED